jgi:hypothetical protein
MASTYSNLKIELMGTGDQSGTWGTTTNTNLGTAIEEAITGTADVSFSSADVTLTLTNTNTAQTARNLRLNLVGTVGAAQNLIVPAIEKQYIINNTLGFAITVKNSTGTGVSVPAGKSMLVFNTGSNVVEVVTALATGTVIPVVNGGTGASTASITSFNNITGYTASGATGTTSTNLVFSGSPTIAAPTITGTLTASGTLAVTGGLTLDGAAGTAGQVMVSAGSGNTPIWGSGFPSGGIIMWSGSIATIPSGWLLCDGTNSTPDLRNRFVIGAFVDNAGVANTTITGSNTQTGGSKDAIVVSHSHTATVSDPGHNHLTGNPDSDGGSYFGVATASGGNASARDQLIAGLINSNTYVTNTKTTGVTVSNSTTGSSGTNANLNPYYALAFIMKS